MANRKQLSSLDDEISIADLYFKLWKRRGLIVALPVLSVLIGLISLLFQAAETKSSTVYFVNLTSVTKGLYPNGVQFSPQDLKSPEILDALAARSGLADTGSIRNAIVVSYASLVTKGILKKYEGKLGQKGINAAQIDAWNADLEEELSSSTQRTMRISIDHQALGLNSDQGGELAILLPKLWSEIYTTRFRVLDSMKLSGAFMPEKVNLGTTIGIIEAHSAIENMLQTLEIIEADNRLQSLNGSSGVTPTDLRLRLSKLNDIYVTNALSVSVGSGDKLAQLYLSDMALELEKLDEKIVAVDYSIESIQRTLFRGALQPTQPDQPSPGRVQLSADAIGQIEDLVNRAGLTNYLTKLHERRDEIISKRSDLQFDVRKMEASGGFSSELIKAATNKLNNVIEIYVDILKQAREMNKRHAGEMHQALGAPFIIGGSLFPQRAPVILALSLLIGVFVAVVAALLLTPRKNYEV